MRAIDRAGRWRLGSLGAAVVVALLVMLGAAPGRHGTAALQDATPGPEDELVAEELDGGEIDGQVIAHGLAFLPEEPAVWRVREVTPPPAEEAESVAGDFSFILQRSGVSVVRNDVTGKRARLEPGEAYFRSADDPYTVRAEGAAPSAIWIFETAPPNQPADEAPEGEIVFTSEAVASFPGGARDVELIRNRLEPNEEAALPEHSGAALLVVTNGSVEVVAGVGAPPTLEAGAGLLTEETPALRSAGTEAAIYVAVIVGEEVRDPGEAAAGTPETAGSPAAAVEEGVDSDEDGLTDAEELEIGTDPANVDTDEDGLTDGQEIDYTDPFSADTDGDGFSDGDEELVYGTDPNDPESVP